MEDIRGREGKLKGAGIRGGDERLWTLGNDLRVSEGEGRDLGALLMGDRRVCVVTSTECYANNGSWNTTSETSDALYGD